MNINIVIVNLIINLILIHFFNKRNICRVQDKTGYSVVCPKFNFKSRLLHLPSYSKTEMISNKHRKMETKDI